MMSYNFLNQLPINDAAENWQCLFQDSGTPTMEGIVNLHHDLTYILIIMCVMVVWLLSRALYFFNKKNNIKPAKFIHETFIEIIWTPTPAIVFKYDIKTMFLIFIVSLPLGIIETLVSASKGEGCLQEIADSMVTIDGGVPESKGIPFNNLQEMANSLGLDGGGVSESKNVSLNSPLASLTLEEKELIKLNGNETTPIGLPQSDSVLPPVNRTGPSGTLKRSLVESFGTNNTMSQPKK